MSNVVTKTPGTVTEPTLPKPASVSIKRALRLRESAASVIPYVEYGAQRLGKLGIIGLSLCIFSVIAFLSGNTQLRNELGEQMAALNAAREAAASGEPTSSERSPEQRATMFVGSLPTRNDIPGIMASVVAVAAASGLELESGSYEYVTGDDAISRYRISIPVNGSYPQIRKFVENTLATVPVIALDSLRVERDSVSQQVIQADLRFSVLLGDGS
jgi:hypothetical protein